jgi:hypothetical protein
MTLRSFSGWHQVAILVAGFHFWTVVAAPVAAADLSGSWSGHWRSDSSGHQGPLQAEFRAINATQYRVDFSGRFFKILPFRYSVTLNVVRDDSQTIRLSGRSYLGRLFGTFHYRAHATTAQFTANYSSRNDCGQFVLCRRCGPGP